MIKVKVSNIVWDTKDAEFSIFATPELPTETIVDVEPENVNDNDEINELAIDAASDKHYFCILSANCEVLIESPLSDSAITKLLDAGSDSSIPD